MKLTGLGLLSAGLGSWLVACDDGQNTSSPAIVTKQAGPASELGDATPLRGPASELGDTPPSTPITRTTPAPASAPAGSAKPSDTALAFLKAWEEKRYGYMYALLNTPAKNSIEEAKFISRYEAIAEEMTLVALETKLNVVAPPPNANAATYQMPFEVTFKTARVGDFKTQNTILLRPEGGRWLIDWNPTLILPQLEGTNLIQLRSADPPRGDIKDVNSQPLAIQGSSYSVFVVPGKIENEEQVLTSLSQQLGMDKAKIKNLYVSGRPDWRMPIKDLPRTTSQEILDKLIALRGVGVDEKSLRFYPNGANTAHVVGYMNTINAEDLKTLAAKGYKADDKIGRTGVEAWAEDNLAGARGGKLVIVKPEGTPLASIAERLPQPASNITLTLDVNIQRTAEAALAGRIGSVVVMNPVDGAILALVSQPNFDPNAFIQGLTEQQYKALNDDPRRPFQNRPVNGTYPTGSIFKAITASAALDRAGFTMESRFTCTGHWEGLGAQFAKDCYLKTGHGNITLYEALVQSCDVVFYEVGKKLDEIDRNLLPGFTKACGLGASTGLVGLDDTAGLVPDGKWKLDNLKQSWFSGDGVNLAIGQGYLLASPLQMASVYAGIANGGSVPVPRLIARSEKSGVLSPVTPKTRLQLPVNAIHLNRIRQALAEVPTRGTARTAFAGSKASVAGKTGTAESGKDLPHAWFACYTPVDRPKYVIVVMLEQIGEGSNFAAPVARKIIDTL